MEFRGPAPQGCGSFEVQAEVVTGHLRKREPRATIDAVRMGRKKMFVSSEKAERELGWKTIPVDHALRRAVEWFQANGYA